MAKLEKIEICALCGNESQIRDSHYFAKAIYKIAQQMSQKNGVMIVDKDNNKRTLPIQIKQYLLCTECENRFKTAEDYFLDIAFNKNFTNQNNKIKKLHSYINSLQITNSSDPIEKEASLLEIIAVCQIDPHAKKLLNETSPILLNSLFKLYSEKENLCSSKNLDNIDNTLLYYYAVSIFWRSSFKWNEINKVDYPDDILKAMKEYLLDKRKIPHSFHITVMPIFDLSYCINFVQKTQSGNNYIFIINQFVFYLKINNNIGLPNFINYEINIEIAKANKNLVVTKFKESTPKGKQLPDITW